MTEEEAMALAGYEKGLNDAWDIAKRRMRMMEVLLEYDISFKRGGNEFMKDAIHKCQEEIFNDTPIEARNKVEEWENERDFKIGDEVEHIGMPGPAWIINMSEGIILIYSKKWGVFTISDPYCLTKTGRHSEEIEKLMETINNS